MARINIFKKFPEYFIDEKALELEQYLPQGADKGASEYSNMASAARYYNMDKTVTEFAKNYTESSKLRDRAMIDFLLSTGIRVGELVRLNN